MAAKFVNQKRFNTDVNQIASVVKDIRFSQALNLELKSENPNGVGVWFRFHHGVTFTSWGEKITITVNPATPCSVDVTIESECAMPTQIIDYGKNTQNVRNIFEYIEKHIANCVPNAQPTDNNPNRGTSDIKFCTKCGTKLSRSDNFCRACGAKQNQ